MPSKYRRDYEHYRQRLIGLGSYCNRCKQPRQNHEPELNYHHLIPKYLLVDHRYGVLLCRKCHPIVLAEQRSELRRVGGIWLGWLFDFIARNLTTVHKSTKPIGEAKIYFHDRLPIINVYRGQHLPRY